MCIKVFRCTAQEMPMEPENQKPAAAPPVKKTVVVPKNVGVPIRQAKTNIFDPDVCRGIDWKENCAGNEVGSKERETQPDSTPSPEGQPPNGTPTPEGLCETPSSSVPHQADGSSVAGGGGRGAGDVPEWVRETLQNARIPHVDFVLLVLDFVLLVLVDICLVCCMNASLSPFATAGPGSHLELMTSSTTSALIQIWPCSVHVHERSCVCVCLCPCVPFAGSVVMCLT